MYVVAEWSIVSNVEHFFTKPVLWTNQQEATERSVQDASTFLVTQVHIK